MKKALRCLAVFGLAGATLVSTSEMKTAHALNPEPPDIVAVDLSQTTVCPSSITVNGAAMKVTCGDQAVVYFRGQRVQNYTTVFSRWRYTCPSGQVMEITSPPSFSDVLHHWSEARNWTTLALHCPGDNAFNNNPKKSQLKMEIYRKSWEHNGGRYYHYTITHYG